MATVAELRFDVDSRDIRGASSALQRLESRSERTERAVESLNRSTRQISGVMRTLSGVLTAVVSGLAVREVLQYADAWQRAENRLRLVTDTTQELVGVQQELVRIAQRTFQTFGATADLYSRLALSTEDLAISQSQLLGLTETIGQAIALSGASAQSAQAALFQLGQGLAAGVLRGEELNSVLEQTPELARAIAEGLGVGLGELRRLGQEGELTAERVIGAIQRQAEAVEREFSRLQPTIGQVGNNLREAFAQELIRPAREELEEFARVLGDPNTLENIRLVGSALGEMFAAFISAVTDATEKFNEFVDLLQREGVLGDIELEFTVDGESVTNELLRIRRLTDSEAGKIALQLDEQALEDLQKRIAQIKDSIAELSVFAEDDIGALARLGSAQTELENLSAVVAKAAALFPRLQTGVEGVNDALSETPGAADAAAQGIGEIEQSLRDQLALARQIEQAARQGGESAVEFIREKAEIDRQVAELFEKAQEAGENLTREQIRALVEQIDESIRATDRLIEAEQALQDRLSEARARIAEGIEDQIGGFLSDIRRADLSLPSRQEAFIERFERILADFEVDSIGLEEEDLRRLENLLEDAGVEFGAEIEASIRTGAREIRAALQFGFGAAIDDILFGGGRNLGRILEGAARDVFDRTILEPLTEAIFEGEGGLFEGVARKLSDLTDGFQRAGENLFSTIDKSLAGIGRTLGAAAGAAFAGFQGFQIGQSLSALLGITGNPTSVRAGAALGGLGGAGIGFIAGGPVGALIGSLLGSAGGGLLGGLFSKPSNKFANTVFDPLSGQVIGSAQKDQSEEAQRNAAIRDAVVAGIGDLAGVIAEITGATIADQASTAFRDNLLNVQVDLRQGIAVGFQGDRGEQVNVQRFALSEAGAQQAIEETVRRLVGALEGGNEELVRFAQGALEAGQSVEDMVRVLQVLGQAAETGSEQIFDYALAAAEAGLSAEKIVEGVGLLQRALSLADEPMSEIEQALRNIDDAINPAIEALQAVGKSFEDIAAIGQEAARRLGESFIDGVRDLNLRLQNGVLADYKALLDEIAQRQNDAFALLQRGAITQEEFDFVVSTGGLQAARFFETLPEDERENLAQFLGLLGEVSGDLAVARAELEEQFDALVDNAERTARGLEDAARNFERLAEGLRATADRIRTEFGGLTPRDTVTELLGRLTSLRADALEGNESALQALPQVVNALVQVARQAFGGTEEFARIRDIGLAALDEAATVADTLAKQNFEQAEAVRSDAEILRDIRILLEDERQLVTLQNILDEGRITNDLIAQQLQAFINLFGQDARPANELTAEEIRQAAEQRLLELQRAQPQPSSSSGPATAPQQPSGGSQGTLTDAQLAQIIADNAAANERLSRSNERIASEIEDLTLEIRRDRVTQAA